MSDLLAMCDCWPQLHVRQGELLIEKDVRSNRLYVLKRGAFDVVRDGVRVVRIREPGAFLGEISAVLASPATADVVAAEDSVVHVVDDAATSVKERADLTYAIAQLLARRLSAVTAYLVDIKRQYADTNSHLGLMDQVLGNLMTMQPTQIAPGSQRTDVPDY